MVKFFGAILRGFSEVLSIVTLIIGGVLGYFLFRGPLGFVFGLIFAFILCTLFFGLIGMVASNGDKLNKLQEELDALKNGGATPQKPATEQKEAEKPEEKPVEKPEENKTE